jgi:hypothetical protein
LHAVADQTVLDEPLDQRNDLHGQLNEVEHVKGR